MAARFDFDLDPVTFITVGAEGPPGHRTFFLQAAQGRQVVSLLIEKQQATALAEGIEQILSQLYEHVPEQVADLKPAEGDLALLTPLEPSFRVTQMGIGVDEERRLMVLVAQGGEPADEDDDEDDIDLDLEARDEGARPLAADGQPLPRARFTASYGQMLALAHHAVDVAEHGGRPRCPTCGEPMDPEGHFCPRRNGHHRLPEG